METDFSADLREISKRCCVDVCNLIEVNQEFSGLSPRLIIPNYTKNKSNKANLQRISEQETRFLFAEVLNSTNYFYSIKTPTDQKYCFNKKDNKKKKKVSARTDLSLYVQDNYNSLLQGN